MIVVIDAGNTRIKWARVCDGALGPSEHALWRDDDVWQRVAAALDGAERVVVANVAGHEIGGRIAALAATETSEVEFVTAVRSGYGIDCAYEDPTRMGADRWCALVAARRLADRAFCVIGAGTAVTFDAVAADGRHLGGLILPGERLMIGALAANTKRIDDYAPALIVPPGLALLGRSTREAVTYGAALAVTTALDHAVARVAADVAAPPVVFVCGGDAATLARSLASETTVRADLVLEGLPAVVGERS